jgi:hypothetical protein
MGYTKEQRASDKLLETMREQYKLACEVWGPLYEQARDDIKFVNIPGNQWPEDLKKRRGKRPMYEFPKLRAHVQQVVNEIRQGRPQGKVRGVGEEDQGLAELMQGLCRNIESTSHAENAYDISSEQAVPGGLGFWRICTDYLNDDDLEQDIRIKPIRNFASVKPDPAATEIDMRDARFYFVEELIPKSQFEADYPDADLKDFEGDAHCRQHWQDRDQVRIAEYWYKKPVTRELWVVRSANGDSVVNSDELGLSEDELAAAGLQIVNRRTVKTHKVCMRITNGHEWLTDEYEFPCKYIPIVPQWGNVYMVDGEIYFCGMVRYAKDQQRLHNVHRQAIIEAVAKAPKAPFILKPSWVGPHKGQWDNANAEDYPALWLDEKAPDNAGQIGRAQQAEVPVALIQLAGMDNDDIKGALGQFNPSLGAQSNETSGIAINARKQQGATATFNYPDNQAKAIQFTYEIIGDMIPRVYDTPRMVRILGEDGAAKFKQLYQEVVDPETGQTHILNDIRKGKYDYTVTVGPSFATQRMETAELLANAMSQIGGAAPQFAPLFAYGIVANMDGPGMEEFQTAARKVVVQMGLLPPKEGEQPPEPPPPNPKDVADAQNKQASAALNQAKAEGQQLQNVQTQAQLMHAHMMGSMPPPHPMMPPPGPQFGPPDQPPQGGFFMPDGQPPGPTGF